MTSLALKPCVDAQLLCDFAMDDFLLSYLIEGTPELSEIRVPYNSNGKPMKVDDLKKAIFEDRCKRYVENRQSVTLLKASHLVVTISACQTNSFLFFS